MLDKKDKILAAALDLFANEGYAATSTSKIAKQAGVSEGLIFRHFENKKGLLDALVDEARKQFEVLMAPLLFEQDPKAVIHGMIALPYSISTDAYDFWRLQFKLKWQPEYDVPDKMKPILEKLTWAFSKLGYEDPVMEADMLNNLMESVSVSLMRNNIADKQAHKIFLLKKYKV